MSLHKCEDSPEASHILKAWKKLKAQTMSELVFNSTSQARLLITFANRLDSDQARQNVRPDLGRTDGIPERMFRES